VAYRKYRKAERDTASVQPCPTCKRPTLSDYEARKGYQCLDCTRRDEALWD
jgi:ribosomal protein L37AE/L43A